MGIEGARMMALESSGEGAGASMGARVLPGFFDLQVNGWNGIDFNSPDLGASAILSAAEGLAASGTAAFLPTVVTNDSDAMEASIAALSATARRAAMSATAVLDAARFAGLRLQVTPDQRGESVPFRAAIAGIHIEGPFISPLDGPRGAHNPAFVMPPDLALAERLYRAAGGLKLMMTFAPEVPGAIDLVRWCVARGVVAAIGHTAADSASIARAVKEGAVISTHLGNGISGKLPRHPNPIWDQLADDALAATMIADGHHLPDSVMKVFLRAKSDRLMLVSDATSFAGLKPGRYHALIGGDVELSADGRLSVSGAPGTLAGAARSLLDGVLHLVDSGLLGLEDAWALASIRPARFWGLARLPFEVHFDPVARRATPIRGA